VLFFLFLFSLFFFFSLRVCVCVRWRSEGEGPGKRTRDGKEYGEQYGNSDDEGMLGAWKVAFPAQREFRRRAIKGVRLGWREAHGNREGNRGLSSGLVALLFLRLAYAVISRKEADSDIQHSCSVLTRRIAFASCPPLRETGAMRIAEPESIGQAFHSS